MDDRPPDTVKALLVELKDASELMVDLAYAAVFFNEEKLAEEVERLDERSAGHLRRLRMMAMLAARSPEDAEGMAGVLWIADAIQRIGAAASDVARVIAARLGIPDVLRADLRHADEMTARVRVRDEALAIGQTLRALSLPTETGMWVMAIRSDNRWEFDPGPTTSSSPGDVLLVRGPEEGVNLVRELAGAPPMPVAPDTDAPALSELDRAVDILVEMKDVDRAIELGQRGRVDDRAPRASAGRRPAPARGSRLPRGRARAARRRGRRCRRDPGRTPTGCPSGSP